MLRITLMTVSSLAITASLLACGTDEDCQKAIEESFSFINNTAENNADCEIDDDCIAVSIDTKCLITNSAMVNKGGVSEVEAAVSEANNKWCGDSFKNCDVQDDSDDIEEIPICSEANRCRNKIGLQ